MRDVKYLHVLLRRYFVHSCRWFRYQDKIINTTHKYLHCRELTSIWLWISTIHFRYLQTVDKTSFPAMATHSLIGTWEVRNIINYSIVRCTFTWKIIITVSGKSVLCTSAEIYPFSLLKRLPVCLTAENGRSNYSANEMLISLFGLKFEWYNCVFYSRWFTAVIQSRQESKGEYFLVIFL